MTLNPRRPNQVGLITLDSASAEPGPSEYAVRVAIDALVEQCTPLLRTTVVYLPSNGQDDGPGLAAAYAKAASLGAMVVLSGSYVIKTSTYGPGLLSGIPSHTHLWCAPGTLIHSAMSSISYRQSVPFLALSIDFRDPSQDTTLRVQSTIGSMTLNITAATPAKLIGNWILVGSATLSSCAIFQVVNCVAGGGGGFDCTLDRPCMTHLAAGVQVLCLTDVCQDLHLDFNGALLTGTGLEAFAFIGVRDSYVRGLRIDASGGTFTNYNGVQFNDGSFNCHAIECISDGMDQVVNGPHIANSESCTFERGRVARTTGLGLSLADAICCSVLDTVIEQTAGTGLIINSIRGASSDTYNNHVDHVRISGGGAGLVLDNGALDTLISNVALEFQTAAGAASLGAQIVSATGTRFEGLTTRGSAGYAIRADVDVTIVDWVSDDCVVGSLEMTGAANATIENFAWSMNSTTLPAVGLENSGTGRILLKKGKSTVGVAGGSASVHQSSTGTVVREDVQTFGLTGYIAAAAASMLVDREGVDDSACTNPNVFGVGAQANYGTYVANGATAVVVNYRGSKAGMVLGFTLNAVGGTPAGAPFLSAIVGGTSFSTKAAGGDTSTYTWKDLAA